MSVSGAFVTVSFAISQENQQTTATNSFALFLNNLWSFVHRSSTRSPDKLSPFLQ